MIEIFIQLLFVLWIWIRCKSSCNRWNSTNSHSVLRITPWKAHCLLICFLLPCWKKKTLSHLSFHYPFKTNPTFPNYVLIQPLHIVFSCSCSRAAPGRISVRGSSLSEKRAVWEWFFKHEFGNFFARSDTIDLGVPLCVFVGVFWGGGGGH